MADGRPVEAYRGNLERVIAVVGERGIDLSLYRRAYVERRIAARMRTLDLHSYRQYADRLEADAGEYERLLDTLTINVTEFFRDAVVWEILKRRVLRDLIEAKRVGRNRTIRVWSAGCATGQEAYSIAMALLDVLGPEASNFLVSVVGTDLDPRALEVAENAVYDQQHLRRIPPSYQSRFVHKLDNAEFTFAPEVRKLVRFGRYSLFEDSPMRVVDLILCRNVFIYFDRDQQAKVLENFWTSLARGGYLILGRSEKLSADIVDRLEAIDGRERVYRKPPRP